MIVEQTVEYPPTSLKRHRHIKSGHSYDPSAKDKIQFAGKVNLPEEPLKGALKATLDFYEKRPKCHYRSGKFSDELKPKAPKYNTSKKDIDNFCKFVLDALNKRFYNDDSQIIELCATKNYTKNKEDGFIYMKFQEIS